MLYVVSVLRISANRVLFSVKDFASSVCFSEMLNRRIYFYLLLYLTISNVAGNDKKEDENEPGRGDIVEVEEEPDEEKIEIIDGIVDAIKIIPAPDLTKEDPEHRSKIQNEETDGERNKISLDFDPIDADLLNFIEKTLKMKYPMIFNGLKEQLSGDVLSKEEEEEKPASVEVLEDTAEETEGSYLSCSSEVNAINVLIDQFVCQKFVIRVSVRSRQVLSKSNRNVQRAKTKKE